MSAIQSLPPILEPPNESEECVEPEESIASTDISEQEGPGRSLVDGVGPERALEEGACVCFFTPRGQLMVVRPAGKFWELHAIAVSQTSYDADGNQRIQFYPPESLFSVIKKGKLVGFRSLAAEGKTLQALYKDGVPHRINNHNFGDWETWEQTPEGLVNVKWKKPLGFEVREVRAVAVEDLRGAQKSHLRSVRQWQLKAQNAEFKIAESEQRVKDVLRSNTRQKELHAKELAHCRSRMEEALKEKQKRSVESLQTGAAFSQVEIRLKELTAEKTSLEAAAAHAESQYQSLKREMEVIRERHDGEMHRLELAHSSEMSALSRGKDLELKQEVQQFQAKLRRLQDELDSKAQKKDSRIEELEGHIDGTVKDKDQQIAELLEECSRLHSAIRAIKAQLEQAHVAKQALDNGIALSSGIVSPVLRTSPVSRAWSRGQSRSPRQRFRSGRMSADPVLCIDPVASPLPIKTQNYHVKGGKRPVTPCDRSGARAPTPADDLFASKDMSPTSVHSDGNPPGDSENEPSQETINELETVESLIASYPLKTDDGYGIKGSRQGSGFSYSESDGEESDGYESATEEVEHGRAVRV